MNMQVILMMQLKVLLVAHHILKWNIFLNNCSSIDNDISRWGIVGLLFFIPDQRLVVLIYPDTPRMLLMFLHTFASGVRCRRGVLLYEDLARIVKMFLICCMVYSHILLLLARKVVNYLGFNS